MQAYRNLGRMLAFLIIVIVVVVVVIIIIITIIIIFFFFFFFFFIIIIIISKATSGLVDIKVPAVVLCVIMCPFLPTNSLLSNEKYIVP
jgi:hypothetical protein